MSGDFESRLQSLEQQFREKLDTASVTIFVLDKRVRELLEFKGHIERKVTEEIGAASQYLFAMDKRVTELLEFKRYAEKYIADRDDAPGIVNVERILDGEKINKRLERLEAAAPQIKLLTEQIGALSEAVAERRKVIEKPHTVKKKGSKKPTPEPFPHTERGRDIFTRIARNQW